MSEFVVGQWVEVIDGMAGYLRVGHVHQIEKITDIGTIKLFGNGNCWDAARFKPFQWQVGKTYRTTLEGVTATIDESHESSVVCKLSNGIGRLIFDNRTGTPNGCERVKGVPHLLPFFADEPSEVSETDKIVDICSEHLKHREMADEKNALEAFWRVKKNDYEDNETALLQYKNDLLCLSVWAIAEFNRRLESIPFLADEPSKAKPEAVKPQASSPYDRVIGGVDVDLWTLAEIYGITSHRLFSAWKKITMAGRRGPKDKLRDLKEARVGLDKEIAKLEAEGGE